jgi:hypothetical protein
MFCYFTWQSGSHVNSPPSKRGKATREEAAPKAEAAAGKDRKSASADAADDGPGAAGGRGRRKRSRASKDSEEVAEEKVTLKKPARAGGRQSKASN